MNNNSMKLSDYKQIKLQSLRPLFKINLICLSFLERRKWSWRRGRAMGADGKEEERGKLEKREEVVKEDFSF